MTSASDSIYENDEPIDDEMVVLDLLYPRWGDQTLREINLWLEHPYVELRHCRDFGEDTVYYFRVTLRVAAALFARRFVAGKPQWGYTDKKILRITESGEGLLWDTREKLEAQQFFTSEEWFKRGRR